MDAKQAKAISDCWMIPTPAGAYMAGIENRPIIERAAGIEVIDTAGKRYLDFGSGQMAAALGHNHPLYVEAFPMTEYSMYGAVPLRTIKQALLRLKADGRLDRAKMVDLTNCTFDGHIYNTRRVMEECLAIKPDLIFLWDEAWFGFARFSPFLRPRTAMGAANDIEAWMHDPTSVAAFEKQDAELGKDPSDEVLLKTRLRGRYRWH